MLVFGGSSQYQVSVSCNRNLTVLMSAISEIPKYSGSESAHARADVIFCFYILLNG